MTTRVFAVLLLGLCSRPVLAQADREPVTTYIEKAEAAEQNLEYEDAINLWLEVITHPDVQEEQLLNAHLRAGILQRVLKNDVEARIHFRFLLQKKPDYQLDPDLPPKIRGFFELIRQEVTMEADKAGPAPAPAAAPAEPAGLGLSTIVLGVGGAVGALGLLTMVAGGGLGIYAVLLHFQADAEQVQVKRAAIYDTRDVVTIAASSVALLGGVVVLIGAGAAGASFALPAE